MLVICNKVERMKPTPKDVTKTSERDQQKECLKSRLKCVKIFNITCTTKKLKEKILLRSVYMNKYSSVLTTTR